MWATKHIIASCLRATCAPIAGEPTDLSRRDKPDGPPWEGYFLLRKGHSMLRCISWLVILFCPLLVRAGQPETLAKKVRALPGVEADGAVRLPNGWSIKPAGRQIELGDFPVNIALHPSGKWAAILHAGYGTHEIILVDLATKKERVRSRVPLEQTFLGLLFSPDGKYLYAGGGEFDVVHQFQFDEGFLTKPRKLKVADTKFIAGNLAIHPEGKTLYVPGVWGHGVSILNVDDPKARVILPLGKDSYPFACLVDAKGQRLYVSLWNKAAVAVVDLSTNKVVQTLATENRPSLSSTLTALSSRLGCHQPATTTSPACSNLNLCFSVSCVKNPEC